MLALEARYGRAAVVDALRAEAAAARDSGGESSGPGSVAESIARHRLRGIDVAP